MTDRPQRVREGQSPVAWIDRLAERPLRLVMLSQRNQRRTEPHQQRRVGEGPRHVRRDLDPGLCRLLVLSAIHVVVDQAQHLRCRQRRLPGGARSLPEGATGLWISGVALRGGLQKIQLQLGPTFRSLGRLLGLALCRRLSLGLAPIRPFEPQAIPPGAEPQQAEALFQAEARDQERQARAHDEPGQLTRDERTHSDSGKKGLPRGARQPERQQQRDRRPREAAPDRPLAVGPEQVVATDTLQAVARQRRAHEARGHTRRAEQRERRPQRDQECDASRGDGADRQKQCEQRSPALLECCAGQEQDQQVRKKLEPARMQEPVGEERERLGLRGNQAPAREDVRRVGRSRHLPERLRGEKVQHLLLGEPHLLVIRPALVRLVAQLLHELAPLFG